MSKPDHPAMWNRPRGPVPAGGAQSAGPYVPTWLSRRKNCATRRPRGESRTGSSRLAKRRRPSVRQIKPQRMPRFVFVAMFRHPVKDVLRDLLRMAQESAQARIMSRTSAASIRFIVKISRLLFPYNEWTWNFLPGPMNKSARPVHRPGNFSLRAFSRAAHAR